jgi:dTDP-4-dehydrorhamnose 3,5-epimerase-like enzyme
MSLIKLIDLQLRGDDRGSLIAVEAGRTIPFEIKRAYYIFGTKEGVSRGFHAHRKLQQIAICVAGKCRMALDNGERKEEVWLDSPATGLVISGMTWREMYDFSPDCVLLVLANEYYEEADYIRNYDDFIGLVKS